MSAPQASPRYTSHREMQAATQRHQVMRHETPPVGFMKHDPAYHPTPLPEPSMHAVTVYREKGQGLGLMFERCEGEGLRLNQVTPHSTGDRAGMGVFVGRTLEKVNDAPVVTNSELARACENHDVLTFAFKYQRLSAKKKDVVVIDAPREAVPGEQQTPVRPQQAGLHMSARQFNEEKRNHKTPIVSSPRMQQHQQQHQQQQPQQDSRMLTMMEKIDGSRIDEELRSAGARKAAPAMPEGRWICGDGTPCVVQDGLATFGDPPEATEQITYDADTGLTMLLGATMVACTPYRVEWSDGDTWSRDASPPRTHAMPQPQPQQQQHNQHQQQPKPVVGRAPRGGTQCTLRRNLPQDGVVGIVWVGTSLVIHSVLPHSAADRAGFGQFVHRHVVAVNEVPYTNSRTLCDALKTGALQQATELHFTMEDTCPDANMLV
eukprot:TRINITY_DN6756_c4_g1_i1.p1 TRINITY_DN6756_c4_g1~~TRINITY_DN6756_c4_g1_i1.p1  ORF type:complete len:453 (+),score=150.77 TRINITY_DN6756_c4_g1_i1:61-1359(+)